MDADPAPVVWVEFSSDSELLMAAWTTEWHFSYIHLPSCKLQILQIGNNFAFLLMSAEFFCNYLATQHTPCPSL